MPSDDPRARATPEPERAGSVAVADPAAETAAQGLPPGSVFAGGNAAMARAMATPPYTDALAPPIFADLQAGGNRAFGAMAEGGPAAATPAADPTRVSFVREAGLNLRDGPARGAASLAQLELGRRVHLVDGSPDPTWQRVLVQGHLGYLAADRLHAPPDWLIRKDPALSLIRVGPNQTFWGLVEHTYGITGAEGGADQNINHFINAIRAVNKAEAFIINQDALDRIGNAVVPGRDASDTLLKENVDLWIPSFGVAAAMDVGSGTVTGEIARIVKKVQQKIDDFVAACAASGKYIPGSVGRRCGEMGAALLDGLLDFAKDAAKILAVSTAVGTLIGAMFGGVTAVAGAEIGFEIGLFILEYYGLYMLAEAIVAIGGEFLSQMGSFIVTVWNANGDKEQMEKAGQTLADALGIFVSGILAAVAAYVAKEGFEVFGKTRFAQRLGETRLAKWLADRQKGTTGRKTLGDLELKDLARQEARRLRAKAAAEEPAVTATLQQVAAAEGGKLTGLDNRLKTEERLTEKIHNSAKQLVDDIGVPAQEAVATVGGGVKDALRYTVEVEPGTYMTVYQHTVQALEGRGCSRLSAKNTWAEPGSPQAGPYRGINESWQTANGQVFEVQYHTPESFEVKSETHGMYGEQRRAGTTKERQTELDREMTKISDRITVPPGAVPSGGTWPGGPAPKGRK